MFLQKIISKIEDKFSDSTLKKSKFVGEDIIHIKGSSNLDILKIFNNNGFYFLADITAIDNLTLGGFERFAVVYHLLSHETIERVTVKAYVSEENNELDPENKYYYSIDFLIFFRFYTHREILFF